MSVLKLGIVGTGDFARHSHVPAINAIHDLKITAVYNRTKSKAEDFAQAVNVSSSKVYSDLDHLLADPDVEAVDAIIQVPYNLDTIQRCVAAGKPIAIEKTIAATLEDGREIVKIANSTDIPILILENYIYHDAVAKLQATVPKIGQVVSFTYERMNPYKPWYTHTSEWRLKPVHIGGYLSMGGVHEIAVLTAVLGDIESTSARAVQVRENTGTVDNLSSLFNLKSGVFGTYNYSTSLAATKSLRRFVIYGKQGSIIYSAADGEDPSITLYQGTSTTDCQDPVSVPVQRDAVNGVEAELRNFVEAVKAKDKSLLKVKTEDAFHHYAVIAAAVKSAENNGQVTKVETV